MLSSQRQIYTDPTLLEQFRSHPCNADRRIDMIPFSHKVCERTGLLQWGHVSMLRARKFLDAAVLAGDSVDSVLEQVGCLPQRQYFMPSPHAGRKAELSPRDDKCCSF